VGGAGGLDHDGPSRVPRHHHVGNMTAPCPACGHCEPAAVATWTLVLEWDVPTLNEMMRQGSRRWWFTRLSTALRTLVKSERIRLRIPTATKRRRITVTRFYGGRCKERDYVNLAAGCKALVDSLVKEGLLVDDAPAWVDDHYAQVRLATGTTRVEIVVEELA
jgi:hypothetical protein